MPSPKLWVEPPSPRPPLVVPRTGEWPFTPWSYAKAYAFNLFPATHEAQLRILVDGTWSKHVHSETLVDRAQALSVVRLVGSTQGTFETSKCPFPRHAFVFFDHRDRPVASVDVCFECEDLFASPDFETTNEVKYGTYDDIEFDESGDSLAYTGPKGGLWKEFNAALPAYEALFRDLGLPLKWQ